MKKRGLYPNKSIQPSCLEVRVQINIISYLNGKHDLLDIANICGVSYAYIRTLANKLLSAELIREVVK